mmetsp:Transcript_16938/g.47747  ORF Transcript_16938/g.47747 Transcript_16938/m.47747 type:complete len:231 (-) Transcript_16938:1390-2082(-)
MVATAPPPPPPPPLTSPPSSIPFAASSHSWWASSGSISDGGATGSAFWSPWILLFRTETGTAMLLKFTADARVSMRRVSTASCIIASNSFSNMASSNDLGTSSARDPAVPSGALSAARSPSHPAGRRSMSWPRITGVPSLSPSSPPSSLSSVSVDSDVVISYHTGLFNAGRRCSTRLLFCIISRSEFSSLTRAVWASSNDLHRVRRGRTSSTVSATMNSISSGMNSLARR